MRPIHDMLTGAAGRGRFHMPGHKGRAPFGAEDLYALDTTELPVTDDLYAPENGLLQAQRLYAQAAGAEASIFLHNGSTGGIHVMLQLWAREGDTVLLPRNAHLSAVNGCILGGLRARWIPVRQRADGYCHVEEEAVLAALAAHPQARALLITRPDYYGGCISLERIIAAAHAQGTRVVVDEAHGAHLPWAERPASAGKLGADAWVQSVHKTMPGLTGSAVLHLREESDAPRALRLLRREQTSSPSFLLMKSIDDGRAWMDKEGRSALQRVTARAEALRRRLPRWGYADAHALWQDTAMTFDPTRLVIDAPQGGGTLALALREKGFDVEMHDIRRAVLILAAMDRDEDFDALEAALAAIPPEKAELPCPAAMADLPPRALEVRPAAMAPCEAVEIRLAEGRIAAAPAGLYPPGIPLVCPGEIIGRDAVTQLECAGPQQRFGLEGDRLLCVTENA